MKYFVISDVHGSPYYLNIALEKFKLSGADKIICLGDFYYHGPRNPLTEEYNPMKVSEMFNSFKDKLIAIRGNCDADVDLFISEFKFNDNILLTLDNGKIIYCHHGHNDIDLSQKFDVVLFGHIHIGLIKKEDSYIIANPGSISLPKSNDGRSYLLIDEKSIQRYSLMDGSLIEEFIF